MKVDTNVGNGVYMQWQIIRKFYPMTRIKLPRIFHPTRIKLPRIFHPTRIKLPRIFIPPG